MSDHKDHKQSIKDSIHLPQTPFPMKAHLQVREPEFIQFWEKKGIYHKMVKENEGKPPFTMVDGPPYANGHLHMGHVLNKCLKDFVIKYIKYGRLSGSLYSRLGLPRPPH